MTYTATHRRAISDKQYRKVYRYKVDKGIPTSLIPAGPAQAHIQAMRDLGWSFKALEQMSDSAVCDLTINNLANARHQRIERNTALAALSIPYTLAPNDLVDDTAMVPTLGAQRRVHALLRMGYPHVHMRPLSTDTTHLTRGTYQQMTARRWRLIDTMYRNLCMTPGPSDITATRARVKGLPTAAAWDDIDQPDATPLGVGKERGRAGWEIDEGIVRDLVQLRTVPSTPAEKAEALRRFVVNGGSIAAICRAHGWNDGRYKQLLKVAA